MIVVVFAVLVVAVLAAFLVTRILALRFSAPRLASVESVPANRTAIVFGAGLRRDGTPSPVLRDRIATATRLYFAGKVEKLLMSGDNRFENYNEPGAMKAYAVGLGVPTEDIVLDYAGRRTYDTCYRARDIFRLDSAILVTQAFHLPRALYICNHLGLPAVGVPADQREYRQASRLYWNIRETLATMAALWEVHVTRPVPVLGDPEPIFPQEAQ